MACNRTDLHHYLENFTALDPVNSVVCPYAQDAGGGLGLGIPLFALLVLGPLGLGMTVRMQHPGPLIVAGLLTIGAVATSMAGPGARIAAIVFFFGLSAVGLFLYQRFKRAM